MEGQKKTRETIFVFRQKKVGRGGLGPKFAKRHMDIPIRNKYTNFHWATRNEFPKDTGQFFFKQKTWWGEGGNRPKILKIS